MRKNIDLIVEGLLENRVHGEARLDKSKLDKAYKEDKKHMEK